MLFGSKSSFSIHQILFVLDLNNWNLSYELFQQKFNEVEFDNDTIKAAIEKNEIICEILKINDAQVHRILNTITRTNFEITLHVNFRYKKAFILHLERKKRNAFDYLSPHVY